MRLVTLDFETYYAKDYTLSGGTTEAYIRDPRFEVIGFSMSVDGAEPVWVTGDFHEIKRKLGSQNLWDDVGLICHNTAFDGAILAWRFGIVPKFYFDTLSMARPTDGLTVGGSLKALVQKYLPGQAKGTEVVAALGKRRADFTPEDLAQYGEYCKNDTYLTWQLFKIFSKGFPKSELRNIDLMLRMYTQPVLELDKAALETHLIAVKKRKEDFLTAVIGADMAADGGSVILGHGNEGDSVTDFLMSNKKFAGVLERMGVPPPMKVSPTTGKMTYAFSKTDQQFKALLEHEDERVQTVVAARLGVKSTLEETRTAAFIGIADRGPLPILLNYYGAHTGRASGGDKINLQNLPRGGALRNAIRAPEGHVLVACDSAQIEARVVAWLAGEDELVESFALGKDIYSEFATKVYGRPITKADKVERHVGKTCILGLGYGMGRDKFQATLKTGFISVDMDAAQCERVVNLYRNTYPRIPFLWKMGDQALKWIVNGVTGGFGRDGLLKTSEYGITLPNGMLVRYPDLRFGDDGASYQARKLRTKIYAGKVIENVVQALARIVVFDQMLEIHKRYKVVLTVHDEVVISVPEEEADEAKAFMLHVMHQAPAWAVGLPIAAEAGVGKTYGSAK